MKKTDKHIEQRIDEILDFAERVPRVSAPPSFVSNVMKRFEEETAKGRVISMRYMKYIRVAAALIAFAVIGNLLILITSIKQADTNNDIITAYSSEYNIDSEDQWWVSLASGDYYAMQENGNR